MKNSLINKLKTWIIIMLSIAIAIGFPVMYMLGEKQAFGTNSAFDSIYEAWQKTTQTVNDLKEKLELEKERAAKLSVEVANATARLLQQEEIIQEYETKNKVLATVVGVKDINANLFKEVEVEIKSEEETPWAIFSTDYQLNPETFGNFSEEYQTVNVEYFYGVLSDNIQVLNVEDEKIEISYSKNAFLNPPYRIKNKKTELNFIAKILTSSADNDAYEIINDIGINQLSNIEDAYVQKLKEDYANSDIPIYINGILLENWDEEDKVFSEKEIDSRYRVELVEE